MTTDSRLEAAFRQTLYVALLPNGEAHFKVGVHEKSLERRLQREAGVRTDWAIVTPCNPGAQPLPDADNTRRLDAMRLLIESDGYRWYRAVNRDPSGQWPDEHGLLIIDPGLAFAKALARRFGQCALLHAEIGDAPRLHWT